MTNTGAVLEEIRALARADMPVGKTAEEFLVRSHCIYLLCKTGNPLWKAIASRNEREAIGRYRQSAELLRAMEAEGIPYAQIKGAPLGRLAYGSAGMRRSTDIDLLVSRGDVTRIKPLMKRNGYVQGRLTKAGIAPYSRDEIVYYGMATHQTAPFIKAGEAGGTPWLEIDLNTDLFWGESPVKADMQTVLGHACKEEAVPGFSVSVLEAPYAFAGLCLHHYKDMNSIYLLYERNGYDFSQFCDIYFFFTRRLASYSGNALREIWDSLQASPYVYWMLHYTAYVFSDHALAEMARELESPFSRTLLDSFGLNEGERKQWDIPFEERLFCPSLQEYLKPRLSDKEMRKVWQNKRYL